MENNDPIPRAGGSRRVFTPPRTGRSWQRSKKDLYCHWWWAR